MDDKREFIYHIIDWGLALIGIIFNIIENNVINFILIVCFAGLVSFVIIKCKRNYEQLLVKIKTYHTLLNSPYPLYGIASYISKETDSNYTNSSINLNQLSLDLRLINEINDKKQNDIQVLWQFKGTNISEQELDRLYLRIGGDSGVDYDDLHIKAVACAENNHECSTGCETYIAEHCPREYEMDIEDISSFSTKTFHLLKLKFTDPIKVHNTFKTKIHYIWPQCFNPNFDYFLLDPKNFAEKLQAIEIHIYLDGKVITEDSKISWNYVDRKTSELKSGKKFQYDNDRKCYTYVDVDLDDTKIFFVTIKNTD